MTTPPPPDVPGPAVDRALDVALGLVAERGWPREWRPAPRHAGLACAIIDAVMSPLIRSETVAAVVQRYGLASGFDDGPRELLATFETYGAEWSSRIGTRHRAWRHRDAPLKSDVIARAAHYLEQEGVLTCRDLCTRARETSLRQGWTALPGQSTGSSWRHLLLVAGFDEPLTCRLTRRFLRRHVGRVSDGWAETEVTALTGRVAFVLDAPVLDIDHQMWRAGANDPAARCRGGDRSARPSAASFPPTLRT